MYLSEKKNSNARYLKAAYDDIYPHKINHMYINIKYGS